MTHEEIIAAVESMTVLELADLVKAMEEKFGVSAAAPVAVVAGGAGAAAAAEEEIPSSTWCWPMPVPRRSRSSRLCAKSCPAWA